MRREDSEAVRTIMELSVEGKSERPKKWLIAIVCRDYGLECA